MSRAEDIHVLGGTLVEAAHHKIRSGVSCNLIRHGCNPAGDFGPHELHDT